MRFSQHKISMDQTKNVCFFIFLSLWIIRIDWKIALKTIQELQTQCQENKRRRREREKSNETIRCCNGLHKQKTMVVHRQQCNFEKHVSCIVTNSKDKNVSAYELQTHFGRMREKKFGLRNETAKKCKQRKEYHFRGV